MKTGLDYLLKAKRKRLRQAGILIVTLTLIHSASLNASSASKQSNESRDSAYKYDSPIENVERVIEIDARISDKKIKERLASILESSKKYTDLNIKIDTGLVLISGQADAPQYVEWASEVARNIEGVVAVVNNIEVKRIDYFTIQPIKNELFKLWFKGLEIIPLVLMGFITFLAFFVLSKPISHMLAQPVAYVTDSDLIKIVLKRIISLFFILVGFYFFLRIAGLTQFALAVISGTGMIGLIVGFAFRDIAENFISSLLLSVQRPFRLGDVIEVQGQMGVVRKVTARGTTLVDFDGNHIQIPNAIIYKNIIQNFTANPNMRGSFMIGVGYDSSIKVAQELVMQLMSNHEAVLDEPEPQVLIDNLGSSTVNFKVYFWVNSETYSILKVGSILMRQIMHEFENNGISMPDDAREVIFPEGVPLINPASGNDAGVSNKIKKEPVKSGTATRGSESAQQHPIDDLSSDTWDIRQQAEKARDPEEGNNII